MLKVYLYTFSAISPDRKELITEKSQVGIWLFLFERPLDQNCILALEGGNISFRYYIIKNGCLHLNSGIFYALCNKRC